ncbi:uncharacterized protein LOC124125591 isoform X2 [Haliotis rufescens]|uniref:uncharacterized protein LOC124125591 isoform X2 n=1 Tax=Haliotis rufescens TaxID=6454 RepID=UPI00201EA2E9|nr:uncharacterized protein LOC124125591 isoform X2 [Haliotis rufescens]
MDVWRTVVLLACGFTTYAAGSLHLTPFPTKATEGNTYTLMCSSSAGSRDIQWSRNSALIVRTRYVSATQCREDIINPAVFNTFLSGRINTSCGFNQHNVTLRISSQKDNGSVWWCANTVKGDMSNNLTIDVVVNSMTMPSTTATAATTTTTEATTTATTATAAKSDKISSSKSPQDADNQVVYIAAGVGGGVAVVIVVVVSVLCIRRRRGRPVNNGSAHEHNHEASHTYYNENRVLQDQDINDKVQVENDIYETSRDVTSPNQPSTNDHMITDVYAQVQKPKTNKPGPTGTADDINIEDLYAKPDKTMIRKKQED